jgi:predicted nucleic acid-binding protein
LIVVDASVVLELLLGTGKAGKISQILLSGSVDWHAPELLDVEVASALRRVSRLTGYGDVAASEALDAYMAFDLTRHAHTGMLSRIWDLRSAITSYDASYVALAEALGAPLLTCDAKLARAHGHSAKIQLV